MGMMETARNQVAASRNTATVTAPEKAKASVLETPRPSGSTNGASPAKMQSIAGVHDGDGGPPKQEARPMAWHIARQKALLPLARELGRAVARQLLPLKTASSYLTALHPDCPPGMSCPTGWALHDTIRETELALDRQEAQVRRRIWPLCEQHKPGREVMQAARNIGGPMRDWELGAVCVEVAQTAGRRRHRHG
jgi:hypothetical protein